MDESGILKDVLDRLDRVTQHIIEIKGDMYKASDFRVDAARIYDSITTIQTQAVSAIKDAVMSLDRRIDNEVRALTALCATNATDLTAANLKIEELEKKAIPPWVLVCAGAFASAFLQVVLPNILHAIPHVGKGP